MPKLWPGVDRLAGAAATGARALANRLDKGRAERQSAAPGGPNAESASVAPAPKGADRKRKSLMADPFDIQATLGYKDRITQISYDTLRDLVYRVPIVSSIIQVRVEQVASFGHVASDRSSLGFRVRMRDAKKHPTETERKFCQQCEQFLLRTGVTNQPQARDSFETYLRKITRDSLIFDQKCTEIVPARDGRPAEFYAVDAANIRIASNLRNHVNLPGVGEEAAYVEVWQESVRNSYTSQEMIFGVRNPSTDIRLNGYGTSELEYLLTTVTQILNAWNYNANVFENGTMARGLLNIRNNELSNEEMSNFVQNWEAMLRGVENAHRIPVINSEQGVEYVNLQGATDLGYREWLDFLIKCACSSYKIAPEEINLNYGTIGQTSALSEPNNREKITDSKERGLRPILRNHAGDINQHLIWRLCEDVEFEFTGLDAMGPEEKADYNNKRVRNYMTLNEIRAEEDRPPLPYGDVVLDQICYQKSMQGPAPGEDQAASGGSGDPYTNLPPAGEGQDEGTSAPVWLPLRALPDVLAPYSAEPGAEPAPGPTGAVAEALGMQKGARPAAERPLRLDIKL